MIDIHSLNLIELKPHAKPVISSINSRVTLQSNSFPDYLWGKFMIAKEFNKRFPEYPLSIIEPHDSASVLVVSRSEGETIEGAIRVCFDVGEGLPITNYVRSAYVDFKKKNYHLAEAGRMHVRPDSRAFPFFMACIYLLAIQLRIDFYLIQVRDEHARMYRKIFGARDISETKPCSGCTHLAWEIAATPDCFQRRFPVAKINLSSHIAQEISHG